MPKRLISLIAALFLFPTSLSSCNETPRPADSAQSTSDISDSSDETTENDFSVALVTEYSSADDGNYGNYKNKMIKRGIECFSKDSGAQFSELQAEGDSEKALEDVVLDAVEDGADVIVASGISFADTFESLYTVFPFVSFVLVENDIDTKSAGQNICCLYFKEEDAGFLAGYAAVINGYRSLGFYGDFYSSPTGLYGSGFIQGADAAASELRVTDSVSVLCEYGEPGTEAEDIYGEALSWYQGGVELIFSAGATAHIYAAKAAVEEGGALIACDTDVTNESGAYAACAVKRYDNIIYTSLYKIYENNGTLPKDMAGRTVRIGLDGDSVELSAAKGGAFTLDSETYRKAIEKIKDGSIYIDDDTYESFIPDVSVAVRFNES